MHPDEPVIDPPLVRRLLAECFPRWADLPARRVASAGTDNAMFRLGEDLVARLPRIGWAVEGIAHECAWLPRLAPHLPVAVPEPLGLGRPAAGYPWPWAVLRWLDGENPVEAPPGLAGDLAGFVSALRRVELPDPPAAGRGRPLATRDAPTREAIAALGDEVDAAAVTAVWESALAAPPWEGDPVWVHGDLSPGNVLVAGGRLSAVIDFSSCGVGDPAADLPVAWNLLPAAQRDEFRAALGVDDATWARGRGLALSIALIQLPYYRDTNPMLVANSRHVIGEVLASA
ncbi:aminoglycoside phosphotransferase family protein [Saccharothrix australiensis]|uniref:Aminoglycoside phosphotransferase (APT) family kinase protein n=1 Tax=Saccharothrix australiensis TaxID=2072 RepID=A0A495W7V2_9PSEU|nr:aminoglycoside phosphotransferase family protein [Saccharothrix australiensis]RKT56885.1 aminoglycoside phosphotransferase (APT) family kinase protein [Saccharothrix australiensis]